MKLIGTLKTEVDKARTKVEKRELIEKAGMKLDDSELEMVTGGTGEDWNEIARRMYDNTDHELGSENDITKIPDLASPHSKKSKGKLLR